MNTNKVLSVLGNTLLILVVSVLLPLVYFYWQPYEKCLVQPVLVFYTSEFFDLLTRILYYFLFYSSMLLIAILVFDDSLYLKPEFNKKLVLRYYLIMYLVRLGFDALIYIISLTIYNSKIAIVTAYWGLESIFNIVSVFLSYQLLMPKAKKNNHYKTAITGFLLVVSMVVLLKLYFMTISLLKSGSETWQYTLQLVNLLRDVITVFFPIMFVYFSLEKTSSLDELRAMAIFSKQSIRIGIIIVCFMLIGIVKGFLIPYSSINSMEFLNGKIQAINRSESYSDKFQTIYDDDLF